MIWLVGLVGGAVITALIAVYVVWLRPWMRDTPWGAAFLAKIEPIERKLFWKSESLLWSRFKVFLGTSLSVLVAIDWNSVAPILPEKYRPIFLLLPTVFVALDGLMGEPLRRDISKPLDIVAMRTDAPIEVQLMAEKADTLNKKTAAVVAAADKAADAGVENVGS